MINLFPRFLVEKFEFENEYPLFEFESKFYALFGGKFEFESESALALCVRVRAK